MRKTWITGLCLLCAAGLSSPGRAEAPASLKAPVVLGVEDDWPPFAWTPRAGAGPQGFAVELVRAAFKEAGLTLELRAMPFGRCMREARQGVLVGCFNALDNEDTRADFLWHAVPLFREPLAIFARADMPGPRSMEPADLAGKTVGYNRFYTYAEWFSQSRTILRVPASSDGAMLQMLHHKRVDYVVIGASVAAWRLQADSGLLGLRLRKVGEDHSNDAFWIAFSKNHVRAPAVARALDEALRRLTASGRYRELQQRFLPVLPP